MPEPKKRCPKPGCKGHGIPQGTSGFYGCSKCGGLFDDEPNEGGDYSDRDPSARLQRQERRAKR